MSSLRRSSNGTESLATATPHGADSTNGNSSLLHAVNGSGGINLGCACCLTRRAARSVTSLYDLVMAPSGLKATQFILLRAIADAGQIAQWQLGKNLSIAVETLTRRLASMRRVGWVELQSGVDKREHIYKITDLGRQQMEAAVPYWLRAQERLKEQLGDSEWEETRRCLDRLAVAAERSLSARVKNVVPRL